MSPLNHKRTTSYLAPPIFIVEKNQQLKDRRFPIKDRERGGGGRERERQREREREGETDRQTERDIERVTDRQTERDREREREKRKKERKKPRKRSICFQSLLCNLLFT